MAINMESVIKLVLKEQGITGPLVPIAIKVLMEQFESGEAIGSDVFGPFTAQVNPIGTLAAVAGTETRKRSKKQKAQDKKKSAAWKQANEEGRKNNGEFRAGWDQKRVATRANKLLKKM